MDSKETDKKKATPVIINTVLCVILFFISLAVLVANTMSAAAVGAPQGIISDIFLYATFAFPVIPFISIIGSWVARAKNSAKYLKGFIILPWAYTLFMMIFLFVFMYI